MKGREQNKWGVIFWMTLTKLFQFWWKGIRNIGNMSGFFSGTLESWMMTGMYVSRNNCEPNWDDLCMITLPFTGVMILWEFLCWRMSRRRRLKKNAEKTRIEDWWKGSCRIQQCQLCGIGMLRSSQEFIKILDERMELTSDYMLYLKKEILVKGEQYRSGMWPGVNAVKDVDVDILKEKISDLGFRKLGE